MSWLLIKFTVPDAETSAVADALEACGAASVSVEAAGTEERLQAGVEPTAWWSENRVTGLFPEQTDADATLAALGAALGAAPLPPYRVDRLDDADWGRTWMAHYQPLQVAPNLWINPSWCTPPDPEATNLLLDPGLAFGTGTHPSTALCLAWLAAQPLAGITVLDYGCGSGILAIAALKLGAARAVGIDLDPQARAVSRDNARRNGVAERYQVYGPDGIPRGCAADMVIANILAPTLIELTEELCGRVAGGGMLAMSGILADQEQSIRDVYAPHFALTAQERDGWLLLAGRRLR